MLPKEVFEKAASSVLEYENTGLSILEIGHRTPAFIDIMEEARGLVRELMALDGDREVLFLHGGASTQFMQVPMNLLDEKNCAAFADTGVWSSKAIREAKIFGRTEVVCSSKDKNYNYIPADFAIPNDARYFHLTTNNTIYGTQWRNIPRISIPVVADMSSDILSRPMDFNAFDLIYAGAQKNLGVAGTTLVIVNKNILGKVRRQIPTMFDYRNHIAEKSMLNTPPVFAVFVSLLTLRWLKAQGGAEAMAEKNMVKAAILYDEIDRNDLFTANVEGESRSLMNVCFTIKDAALESRFLEFCEKEGIYGIRGHRSAGGFRASLYNAMPIASVEHLVEVMRNFSRHSA